MAIQINEVIIRAVVGQKENSGNTQKTDCPDSSSSSNARIADTILEILREKKER